MLERYFTLVYARLQTLAISVEYQAVLQQKRPRFQRTVSERLAADASRQQRLALYEQIQSKRRDGWNIAQLSKELGHHPATIRKYYYATTFPERKVRKTTSSILDPYLPYLEERLAQGCENAMEVWREIQTQGYRGTARQVLQWMHMKRTEPSRLGPKAAQTALPRQRLSHVLPSSQQLAWLMVRDPHFLKLEDQILLRHLQQDLQIQALYALAQRFVLMVKTRLVEALDPWLRDCEAIGIVQIQNFALGLQQDFAAIYAALSTPWSNGQTEGQVNRLKFIKRQMYGRAKFDLLRLRVLAPP
jgi:transposase